MRLLYRSSSVLLRTKSSRVRVPCTVHPPEEIVVQKVVPTPPELSLEIGVLWLGYRSLKPSSLLFALPLIDYRRWGRRISRKAMYTRLLSPLLASLGLNHYLLTPLSGTLQLINLTILVCSIVKWSDARLI